MSVIRNRHNAQHPFVILDKKTLWNSSLSLKALGLWARCISRPDDWTFCIKELIKNCKEGRDSIYGGIKELIEARLCIRIQHRIPNEKNGNTPGPVEYIFLEVPVSNVEALQIEEEMEERFKKSLSHTDFQEAGKKAVFISESEDPGTEDPGNRTLPNKDILLSKEEEPKKYLLSEVPKGPPTPQEAIELSTYFLQRRKKLFPKMKDPNLAKWAKEMRLMHERDHRSWEEIKEAIDWVMEDEFWCKNILSVDKLRLQFDKLLAKMTPVNNKGSQREKCREIAREIKSVLISHGVKNNLQVFKNKCFIGEKNDTLGYDMNPIQFEEILAKTYGLEKEKK